MKQEQVSLNDYRTYYRKPCNEARTGLLSSKNSTLLTEAQKT